MALAFAKHKTFRGRQRVYEIHVLRTVLGGFFRQLENEHTHSDLCELFKRVLAAGVLQCGRLAAFIGVIDG